MAYQNINGAPREKAMLAAYVLVTEFGARQVDVASVFRCSQGTIHQWVKEIGLKKTIHDLSRELADVRGLAQSLQLQIQDMS